MLAFAALHAASAALARHSRRARTESGSSAHSLFCGWFLDSREDARGWPRPVRTHAYIPGIPPAPSPKRMFLSRMCDLRVCVDSTTIRCAVRVQARNWRLQLVQALGSYRQLATTREHCTRQSRHPAPRLQSHWLQLARSTCDWQMASVTTRSKTLQVAMRTFVLHRQAASHHRAGPPTHARTHRTWQRASAGGSSGEAHPYQGRTFEKRRRNMRMPETTPWSGARNAIRLHASCILVWLWLLASHVNPAWPNPRITAG